MHIVNNKKRIIYPSVNIYLLKFRSTRLHYIRFSSFAGVPLYRFKSGTCMDGKMNLHNFAHGRICRKNAQDEE